MSPLIKYLARNKYMRFALPLLVAFAPLNVYALGFGKPAVESSLGEPLRIVLPLTALEANEIDELVARLAAPSWFQLSGLDYGEINDQLIVSVDKAISALVVSTRQPVSQVVVPLVIELEGPRKIMRKQFTVLINPATYDQALSSAETGNTAASSLNLAEGITGNPGTSINDAQPDSANAAESAQTTGLLPGADNGNTQDQTPATTGSGANLVANPSVQSSPLPARADRVVVAKGDSLSTIVDRFLPNGANRYQGRMAFYNVNPQAFPEGNIHTLTRGAELIVPPEQDILALPAAQARRDYQALATLPIPGAAPTGAEGNNQIDSSNQSGQATAQQTGQNQQAGFTLSLLEVEEEATEENAAAPDNNVLADNTATDASEPESDAPLALTSAAAGEQFEMQGFTMKLSVMNAYIVELQEENQELKTRVAALEEKVQALIARESSGDGVSGSLPEQTEDAMAATTDTVDQADTSGEESAGAAVDSAADSAEDLASVLANSPELLALEESTDELTSLLQEDDDAFGTGVDELESTTLDTATGRDESEVAEEPVTPVEELASTEAPSETDEESDLSSEVTSTVDQMLAELDAELNVDETVTPAQAPVQQLSDASEAPAEEAAAVEEPETVRNSVDVTEGQTAQPQATFRQGLLEKAQGIFSQLNGPILQLLIAVLLLAALLFAWMMRRGKKTVAAESSQPTVSTYAEDNPGVVGVTYSADNQISILEDGDEDDEQWLAQQDVSMENLDTLEGSDVDLITQSEVYLTYNRPMQAVQALMEEYSKKDTDKFVVGSRLIKVFEKIGGSDERNTAMRNFIVTLNNDIEEFTNSEWDALRFDLDALRRHEQATALEKSDDAASLDMNSFNQLDEQPESSGAPKLDESVIDLDFHVTDKSG